ncbi:MAG: hypothetical protein ACOY5Y_14025 [Pseudomonadota bacterium]
MSAERWAGLEAAFVAMALIAVGVASFGSQRPRPAAGVPSELELTAFGRQARAACACEASGKDKCWDAFTASTQGRGGRITSSACDPVSAVLTCFGDGATGACTFMKYLYRGGKRSATLCEKADAQAVERAWTATYDRTRSYAEADREVSRLIAAIRRGEGVEVASGRPGCAG